MGSLATWRRPSLAILLAIVVAGLGQATALATEASSPSPEPTSSAQPSTMPDASGDPEVDVQPDVERPEWFDIEMIDVQTGEPFAINDFAGKVVLLETMAVWCPTCRKQGDEVVKLTELLGDPDDLVSISLDVDVNEDAELLARYAEKFGFDWHIAVAPLPVARALGNLYSAQYLNPPLAPMLIVDRDGSVLGLPFSGVKDAESLQGVVEPLLYPDAG
jgi:thiol-disulfide isomerase/thioredoxin